MPWDRTRLLVAALSALERPRIIAGEGHESVEQIAWSSAGTLYFSSDRSGWANIYAWNDGITRRIHAAQYDFSHPIWQLRATSLSVTDDERILTAYVDNGVRKAALLDERGMTELAIGQINDAPQRWSTGLAFIAEPPDAPAMIRRTTDLDAAEIVTIRSAAPTLVSAGDVSIGRPMRFPVGAGETTHAFFFEPRNARVDGPTQSRPPLIVTSHGGPTSMRTNAFNLGIQFWTTRGFAVADVNYRGSTGYGAAYRNRLRGQWGIVDVEDCIAVAAGLAADGLVDPERIAIRGGSSSGFTTLAALAASRVFRAGASYYPVTDLGVFIGETHKFESRYIDSLIGPPDAIELYRSRSPVENAAAIVAPVAIFQGLDDKVVPPNQSERMVAALRANGTVVEYHPYAGEGHGFLKAETLEDSLSAELAFYRRTLDLDA
jgi:dipeptidyl aminopeptidase/acylaminoacyl peptidase